MINTLIAIRLRLYLLLTLIYYLLCFNSLYAQYGTIKGKVLDAKNLQPLAFANVYINFTTKGTYTKENGEYTLENIPLGKNELVISFAGYQLYKTKIVVKDSAVLFFNVKLSSLVLKEITVLAKKDDQWQQQLKRFQRLFFGNNSLSTQCKILNPWVLEFKESANGTFKAEASSALNIENLSLGYRLSYQLNKFEINPTNYLISGFAWFQEIDTVDSLLLDLWDQRRKSIYYGSARHLFKAILDRKVSQEGFDIYEDVSGSPDVIRQSNFLSNVNQSIIPLSLKNRITSGDLKAQNTLQLPSRIEVHYLKKNASPKIYRNLPSPISWIEVKGGKLSLNNQGVVLNPSMMIISGAMSESRISELLPYDYEPAGNSTKGNEVVFKKPNSLMYLAEKPYLHLDKSYYYPSESIWFKAYINYFSSAYKDSLSKVLYVDLVDSKQRIRMTRVFPINNSGFTQGDIPLTLFNKGDYQIRAYTRWMLNFGQSFIYQKTIKILDYDEDVISQNFFGERKLQEKIMIETAKEQYQPGEVISINILTKDDYGYPVSSDLSISVSRLNHSTLLEDEHDSEDFSMVDDLLKHPLSKVNFHTIQYGIDIKGHVETQSKRRKFRQATLTFTQEKASDFFSLLTETDGSFLISNLHFFDSARLMVSASSVKGSRQGKVILDSVSISPMVTRFVPLNDSVIKVVNKNRFDHIDSSIELLVLDEVTVLDSRPEEVMGSAAHLQEDLIVTGDALRSADNGDMLSMLQSRIPGLRIVVYSEGGVIRKVLRLGGIISFDKNPSNQEPIVLVDGNILYSSGEETAAEQVSRLSASTIDRIEVIKYGGGASYGMRGANGVISIYTNNNFKLEKKNSQTLDKSKFEAINAVGYSSAKEFKPLNIYDSTLIDNRSTIYWNPQVRTDRIHPKSISFTIPNSAGQYLIKVEGMSKGKMIRSSKSIFIK